MSFEDLKNTFDNSKVNVISQMVSIISSFLENQQNFKTWSFRLTSYPKMFDRAHKSNK